MERGRVATLYLGHGEGLRSAQSLGVCEKKAARSREGDTRLLLTLVSMSGGGGLLVRGDKRLVQSRFELRPEGLTVAPGPRPLYIQSLYVLYILSIAASERMHADTVTANSHLLLSRHYWLTCSWILSLPGDINLPSPTSLSLRSLMSDPQIRFKPVPIFAHPAICL